MKKLAFALVLTIAALGATGSLLHAQALQLPTISVAPASYNFGNVPVFALATTDLVISNTGDLALNVTAVKTKAPFTANANAFTVQPHSTRRITIAFAPTAQVQYNGSCTIVSNAYNAPSLVVPLSGTGQ